MPKGTYFRTEVIRQKQREAMARHENPGKNKTQETKKKIGDSQRGKPKSEEFRAKCRERMKGKPSPNWKGGIYPSTKEGRNAYYTKHNRKKIGFTEAIFELRLKTQDFRCPICGVSLMSTSIAADHCHITRIPRGILCRRCNLILGMAKEETSILLKAIEYLEKWKRTA